jgi:hypothetical protein
MNRFKLLFRVQLDMIGIGKLSCPEHHLQLSSWNNHGSSIQMLNTRRQKQMPIEDLTRSQGCLGHSSPRRRDGGGGDSVNQETGRQQDRI